MPGAWLQLAVWLVLITAAVFGPLALPGGVGESRVRWTVDVMLLFYSCACAAMLLTRAQGWRTDQVRTCRVRLAWTLAWVAFAVHVFFAFHDVHGWSHTHAVEHTEQVSGFGPGIFVSHIFALLWAADVAWWWLSPSSYLRRAAWVGWSVHGFMAFITFCGTVVYESGGIRLAGIQIFLLLGALLILHVGQRRRPSPTGTASDSHAAAH